MTKTKLPAQVPDQWLDGKCAEISAYMRRHGGWAAIEKYGRDWVLAAMIPED